MYKEQKKIVAAVIFTIMIFIPNIILTVNNNLWWDEIITVRYCKNETITEIVKWAARDVHPPLYYILLHIIIKLFGGSLFSMKLFSAVAHFGILLCGLFFVRKQFGYRAMMFFDLYTTVMPSMFFYSVEVRMYEWAMLFVVLCCIMAYYVMHRGRKSDWILLCIFGLCCAYTHYYSLLCAIMIYAILFIYLFIDKSIKYIKAYIISAICTIIGYLPWIPIFLNQTGDVSEGFWINGKGLLYYLSQMFDAGVIPYSLYINIGVVVAACAVLLIKRRQIGKTTFIWSLGCMVSFVTIFTAVYLFSVFFSPIIVIRYLLIVIMLLTMGISVACRYIPKPIVAVLLLFYLLNGVLLYPKEYRNQNVKAEESVVLLQENCTGRLYTEVAGLNDYLEFYGSAYMCENFIGNSEFYRPGDIIISQRTAEEIERDNALDLELIAPFNLKMVNAYMYSVR